MLERATHPGLPWTVLENPTFRALLVPGKSVRLVTLGRLGNGVGQNSVSPVKQADGLGRLRAAPGDGVEM